MINLHQDYIPLIKIHPSYAVCYSEYCGERTRSRSDNCNENLIRNKHTGEMSKKAVKRLYVALDWMLLCARKKSADHVIRSGSFNFKLSMLTLTLPAAQMHTDLYIKKMMLNEFLTIARKKYNLQNYIWKAEKQGNGNIHFHLILDKYIFYKDINRIWNNILGTHGYINKYKENQENKHALGFAFDKSTNKRWNKTAQLKAYKNGVRTHWQQPTATTDIHSLKKITNAKAYLGKYVTKNPDVNTEVSKYTEMYKRVHKVESVPFAEYQEIKTEVKRKLSVQGNLWYISQSLSKLKGICIEITNEVGAELNAFRKKFKDKVLYKDYCAIYKFSLKDIFKLGYTKIGGIVKDYILGLRSVFYPPGELTFSPLGIPLPLFD